MATIVTRTDFNVTYEHTAGLVFSFNSVPSFFPSTLAKIFYPNLGVYLFLLTGLGPPSSFFSIGRNYANKILVGTYLLSKNARKI
jgi:hypothetical protein